MSFIQDNLGIITAVLMGPYMGLLVAVFFKRRTWEEINQYKWPFYLFIIGVFLYIYAFVSYKV